MCLKLSWVPRRVLHLRDEAGKGIRSWNGGSGPTRDLGASFGAEVQAHVVVSGVLTTENRTENDMWDQFSPRFEIR
jgi:hypothetical protein